MMNLTENELAEAYRANELHNDIHRWQQYVAKEEASLRLKEDEYDVFESEVRPDHLHLHFVYNGLRVARKRFEDVLA